MTRLYRQTIKDGLCLGFLMTVIGGCAINPVSGQPEVTLISSNQEKQLGQEEAKKVEQQMGLVEDSVLTGYLDALGQRLAEQSPRRDVTYRFHIVEMPEPNAFALPGGDIYVSRGLLPLVNSEDELAGVVGHEIGHVAARHSVQRISKQAPFAVVFGILSGITGLVSPLVGSIVGGVGDLAQGLVFAPYSRSQETEADQVGQGISARAGWDPAALSTFLSTLEREVDLMSKGPRKPSFFDSHPATPDRVAKTAAHAKELQRTAREPISTSREAFLARLNGLAVGAPAANGVFDGPRFLHPDFDVFLQFPDKWELKNSPELVAGVAPDGEALVALKAVGKGTDPLDGARALEKAGGSPIVEHTQQIKIGNLQAAHTQLHADNNLVVDLTWIAHAGRIYQLAGIAPKKRFDSLRPAFDTVVQSFRPLTPAERAGIREKRIRLVKAHAGETLDALVARSNSSWSKEEVAVANNLTVGGQLKEGQLLKIAVSEPYVPKGR
jgi:predicted Zn-dependent protease